MWWLLALVACSGTAPSSTTAPSATTPPVTPDGPTARVYPGVRDVPVNGLKFRVVWSEDMQLQNDTSEIVDAHRVPVEDAIPKKVWDEPVRVFSFAPEHLEVGHQYFVHLDGFASAEGKPAAPVDHEIVVRPEDTTPPSGKGLQVVGSPQPGTEGALTLVFPEPMDVDSLKALTVLVDATPWAGFWTLGDDDRTATYTPTAKWPADGAVRVAIEAGCKDLAGNELVDRPTWMMSPVVAVKQ